MPDPQPDDGNDIGVSPFALQDAFPDAQGIFTARHRTLGEIKDDCFVVLDANVLLLPYKLEEVSLPDVIAVYRPLAEAGRLVIPAQAAREFAKHRSSKVAELVRYLRGQAGLAGPDLKRKVGALVGYADYEAAKGLVATAREKVNELQAAINKLADGIAANVGEDPVSIAYRAVFANSVTTDPVSPSDENEFREELKKRYAVKRPPGYKDASKPDSGAGDLIIWKTILAEATTRGADCIFVTGDEKADWYVQSSGPFQPRLELIEEYRAACARTLHIQPLSALLRIMKASPSAVEDVQRAESNLAEQADAWTLNVVRYQRRMAKKIKLDNIDKQLRNLSFVIGLNEHDLSLANEESRVSWRAQQEEYISLLAQRRSLTEELAELGEPAS